MFFWFYCTSCSLPDIEHVSKEKLNLCMLGNFSCFLSSADFFSKSTFSKIFFRITIRVSNSLDPDQARHIVGPDLGPNCLQRLSVDDTSRQRIKGEIKRKHHYLAAYLGQVEH